VTRLQTDGDAVRHRLSRHPKEQQDKQRPTPSTSRHARTPSRTAPPPDKHNPPSRQDSGAPQATTQAHKHLTLSLTQLHVETGACGDRPGRRAHTQGAHSQSHRHSRQHSDSQDAKSSALQTVSAHRTYNPHDTSSRRDGHRAWPCALMVDSCARRPICHMQPHTAR